MTLADLKRAPVDAPVLDIVAARWSTRVFDHSATLDDAAFRTALEAARWAASANNSQPWHVIVARRGTAEHELVVSALTGFNKQWSPHASALLVFVAERETAEGKPLGWADYDTGQAAAYFTIQATALGLATHQMGGFSPDTIRDAFDLAPTLKPLTVMAVGTLGDVALVDEGMAERERAVRARRDLSDIVLVDA